MKGEKDEEENGADERRGMKKGRPEGRDMRVKWRLLGEGRASRLLRM